MIDDSRDENKGLHPTYENHFFLTAPFAFPSVGGLDSSCCPSFISFEKTNMERTNGILSDHARPTLAPTPARFSSHPTGHAVQRSVSATNNTNNTIRSFHRRPLGRKTNR